MTPADLAVVLVVGWAIPYLWGRVR